MKEDMNLKPIDLMHKQFSRRLRGYDPSEVTEFLNESAAAFELVLTENARLSERIENLEAELDRLKGIEATLNRALVLAQQTADDVRAAAHKEAELIVREANEKAKHDLQSVSAQVESLCKDKERFLLEFRTLLRSYLEICEEKQGGGRVDPPSD